MHVLVRGGWGRGSLAILIALAGCGSFTGSPGGTDAAAGDPSASSSGTPGTDAAVDGAATDGSLLPDASGGTDAATPTTFACGDAGACARCCASKDKAATCIQASEHCAKTTLSCTSTAQCPAGQVCAAAVGGPMNSVESTSCVPRQAGAVVACTAPTDCGSSQITCTAATCAGVTLSLCSAAAPKCK